MKIRLAIFDLSSIFDEMVRLYRARAILRVPFYIITQRKLALKMLREAVTGKIYLIDQ